MKNCELFTTEKELKEKWDLRKKMAPNDTEGLTFTQWACFADADLALQDKYLKSGLFNLKGGIGGARCVLGLGPQWDRCQNQAFVYVRYVDENGTYNWSHVDSLDPCGIPSSIMGIARALVIEEFSKVKCPLFVEAKLK